MSAYDKEWATTLGFFFLYLLVSHTAVWGIILGTDNETRILGYPLHYFAVLILGWLGVLAVSVAWNIVADRVDEEIVNSGTLEAAAGPDALVGAVVATGTREA